MHEMILIGFGKLAMIYNYDETAVHLISFRVVYAEGKKLFGLMMVFQIWIKFVNCIARLWNQWGINFLVS